MGEKKMIELGTGIELLGLEQKLLTRLKLFKVKTFQEIMQIVPADWDNVTPKVVNALKRYQLKHRSMYNRLCNGGKPDMPLPQLAETGGGGVADNGYDAVADPDASEQRRFEVASSILRAYAEAGRLADTSKLKETMAEIVNAADAFLDALYPPLCFDDKAAANTEADAVHADAESPAEPAPAEEPAQKTLDELLAGSAQCRRKHKLWLETEGECIYCGKKIEAYDFVAGVDSDIEHIKPQALGGGSTLDNIVCSCRVCNREKGDLMPMDFMLTHDPHELADYLKRLHRLRAQGRLSDKKYHNLLKSS